MVTTHNLGFPRIGKKRELKFALERYWKKAIPEQELLCIASELRQHHWQDQSALELVPVGDFSLYDQVLDTSFMLGNIPTRVRDLPGKALDNYFRLARGRSTSDDSTCAGINAGEMTKWFDTNYHYIVPEFDQNTQFTLNSKHLFQQIEEAQKLNINVKPVIIGPITYLWLGKAKDATNKLDLLDNLLSIYAQLFNQLANAGIAWVQVDEPVLVMELSAEWQHALRKAYYQFQSIPINLLLASYFGELRENLRLACELPVNGLHIDAINASNEVTQVIDWLPNHKILSLGVINGRNIWKTDLNKTLDWLAPSCSLLHVPVDLNNEETLSSEIQSWLAFAIQKIDELTTLAQALNKNRDAVAEKLLANAAAIHNRNQSSRVHNDAVKIRVAEINETMEKRQSPYTERAAIQHKKLDLPLYPTTTIGSFPQTAAIRLARKDFRIGKLTVQQYRQAMQKEIETCVREQEALGLDVLVHGEPERNDMVEYFGEQLTGYAFTQFGWVQSYGSRCVKPPIIYGDIARPKAMTVDWIQYAQSLTDKPMKGMLTGPVTILN